MKIKKGKKVLSLTDTKFTDGSKVLSDTFNSTLLSEDIYIIIIWSNSVTNMATLIKRFDGQYNASILQARGSSSVMVLDVEGVTFFGNVQNLIGIEVYEISFN